MTTWLCKALLRVRSCRAADSTVHLAGFGLSAHFSTGLAAGRFSSARTPAAEAGVPAFTSVCVVHVRQRCLPQWNSRHPRRLAANAHVVWRGLWQCRRERTAPGVYERSSGAGMTWPPPGLYRTKTLSIALHRSP